MTKIAYAIGDNAIAFTLVLIMLMLGSGVGAMTGHTTFAWIDGGLAAVTFIVLVICHEMTISRDGGVEVC